MHRGYRRCDNTAVHPEHDYRFTFFEYTCEGVKETAKTFRKCGIEAPHEAHVIGRDDWYCPGIPKPEIKFQDYDCGLEIPHGPHVTELQTSYGVKFRCLGNFNKAFTDAAAVSVNTYRKFMGLDAKDPKSPIEEWLKTEIKNQIQIELKKDVAAYLNGVAKDV